MPKTDFHKLAREESLQGFFNQVKLKDIMTLRVITVYEDDELSLAEEKFTVHKIYYLPVISHDSQLVGLISQKYLYKTHSPRKFVDPSTKFDPEIAHAKDILIDEDSFYFKETLDSYILRNIMNKNPTTLGPDENLAQALTTMGEKNVGCIVVVDKNKKVLGMLTHKEIINILINILKE